jgi:glycosyltransferase involved in cell wall biosynthesis
MLGFLSRPQDLYSVLRRARVLLYPSYADSFSITVLEALCLGVPVVAYDIDALRMIWAGRKGVYTVPTGDPEALARECARILTTSDSDGIRRELAGQSAALLDEYAWDRVVQWERAFYEWNGNGGSHIVPNGGGVKQVGAREVTVA